MVYFNMFQRHTLCIQNRRPGPLGQVRDDRLCRRSKLSTGVRCQVSGVSNCRILTPDTRHLNTADKRNHPYHPSLRAVGRLYSPTRGARVYEPEAEPEAGVNQSRALWTRIFTRRGIA